MATTTNTQLGAPEISVPPRIQLTPQYVLINDFEQYPASAVFVVNVCDCNDSPIPCDELKRHFTMVDGYSSKDVMEATTTISGGSNSPCFILCKKQAYVLYLDEEPIWNYGGGWKLGKLKFKKTASPQWESSFKQRRASLARHRSTPYDHLISGLRSQSQPVSASRLIEATFNSSRPSQPLRIKGPIKKVGKAVN